MLSGFVSSELEVLRMKIAIIGSGVSGLICARLLRREHEITVFEANDYVGGHTNTVDVSMGAENHSIDTGFIVFNHRTYPNFTAILDRLKVATKPTTMSFSVKCDRSGLEYNGTNLNGLFAQRGNLFSGEFLRMVRDILRFNRAGTNLRECLAEEMTVAEFVRQFGYSDAFVNRYLLPMGAAIWSCPNGVFAQFPIRFILDFYHNHGLLNIRDRPTWRVVKGGSKRYVEQLIRPFQRHIRTSCAVQSVRRNKDSVRITHAEGEESFDELIFACHSDQALRMLSTATPLEQRVLSAFPYTSSVATLHTDESVLPQSRRAWAAWNYRIRGDLNSRPSVTYNMNLLQGIEANQTFLVSLNQADRIDPNHELATFRYSHPAFTTERTKMQSQHENLIRRHRTSFCGAWWDAGFHEDGVNSALQVCRGFGVDNWSEAFESDHQSILSTRNNVSDQKSKVQSFG